VFGPGVPGGHGADVGAGARLLVLVLIVPKVDPVEVPAWANANRIEVSSRGLTASDVVE